MIREGFRSIKTHGLMSFATVTIIMACLIIMGSVALLSLNINYLIKDLEKQNEIVAFVDDEIEDVDQAKAIGQQILALDNVSGADFVSRAQAMENYMSKYDKSLMEGIDETVFRHRFIIHLNDIEKLASTKLQLEDVPGVAKVRAHQEYADTFIKIRNIRGMNANRGVDTGISVRQRDHVLQIVHVCADIHNSTYPRRLKPR